MADGRHTHIAASVASFGAGFLAQGIENQGREIIKARRSYSDCENIHHHCGVRPKADCAHSRIVTTLYTGHLYRRGQQERCGYLPSSNCPCGTRCLGRRRVIVRALNAQCQRDQHPYQLQKMRLMPWLSNGHQDACSMTQYREAQTSAYISATTPLCQPFCAAWGKLQVQMLPQLWRVHREA
jgi:hypothetical protein